MGISLVGSNPTTRTSKRKRIMVYFNQVIANEINKTTPKVCGPYSVDEYEPQDIQRVEVLKDLWRTYNRLNSAVQDALKKYGAAKTLNHNVDYFREAYRTASKNYYDFLDSMSEEPYNLTTDGVEAIYRRPEDID